MALQIKADKPAFINSIAVPKRIEEPFAKEIESMLFIMARIFKNQAIGYLDKGDEAKFSDVHIGNFAKVFTNQAAKVAKALKKRFNEKRLRELVKTYFKKADKNSLSIFYNRVADETGISKAQLLANDTMAVEFNASVEETLQWVLRLRDGALTEFTARSLRGMRLGQTLDQVVDEHLETAKKLGSNAGFVARTQIQNFNSISAKLRAERLGITEAYWTTSRKETVRPSHKKREGKTFKLKEGLSVSGDNRKLLPGVDHNCQCTYKFIIPQTT